MFLPIDDSKVKMVWKCANTDCDADADDRVVAVDPTFYQDNGTPVCECDHDMVYSHTEVDIQGAQ